MRLTVYERLYHFNFHLIEARRILEELGLSLRIDEVEDFRRLRWELDEARREANRSAAARWRAWKRASETRSTLRNSIPTKLWCANQERQARKPLGIPGGRDE